MRTRETLILIGALLLCGAAGVVLATQESFAVEVPSPTGPEAAHATAGSPADAHAVEASVDVGSGTVVPATVEAAASPRTDTAGWTTGIVRGDIQLAVSVLDRIKSISIAVEEARRAVADDGSFRNPWRTIVPVKLGIGTPTFEIRDIPFSEFPYVVSVHSPGLNGTRRTLTIDANTPLVDDVVLTITPGSPFSILLRDQHAAPHVGVEVRLVPVGEPLGRRRLVGTSDTFGSVVFEDVLAGDYELHANIQGQPIGEVQVVTVQPGFSLSPTSVRGQGHTVTIPRGVPLEVRVSDAAGYGLADVTITATATDRLKLTVVELRTDWSGKANFGHLTPGVWQIDVVKDGHQRNSRQITIRDGEVPAPLEFALVRLR